MFVGQFAQRVVVVFALAVAVIIVLASLVALLAEPNAFAARKEQFQVAITHTLLPLFTATAASIVTFVLSQGLLSLSRRRPDGSHLS